MFFFFFNDTATTEIYTLSLHDALPISAPISNVRRKLGGTWRTEYEWLKRSTNPKRRGNTSCQYFIKSSLIRCWSGPSGGKVFGQRDAAALLDDIAMKAELKPFFASHNKFRSCTYIFINARDVLAENSDADELDPT